MRLSDGTRSPTGSGRDPGPRQTPLSNNDKTVIRRALDAEAKLGNQNKADGNGDAPELVPTPRNGGRATVHEQFGRAGFSSAYGQIGCVSLAEALLSLGERTARVRQQRRLCVHSGQYSTVCVRGVERELQAADRGYDGPSRPSASISGPCPS